ncbi:hypothetical protein E2P84_20490 [Burkholderia cepacia]|uniref:Uncharacterized protein n=1 Tax=Burkholderia cepacia TaxID=292 RepID=A0AAX2RJ25_BURCE|nr:hypothetical protein [Burkholderia cepacia]TES73986.1 hypothetical protein E2P84_20490 [Burkholderia cepacia]TET05340.1 hypothetical protein E3D36_00065 [Burkholderia cepacia]TEU40313.1 hypothetical protein E3D37_28845 [Burkholderia cepacia]TEU42426.1 hypothetical protein E3D39_15825 [Burkholderia cepacia]TEU57449.1 hypothetical protein E3D38_03210 [Burkholderia cepacia]
MTMDKQQKLIDQLGETVGAPIAAMGIALTHLIQHLHNAGIVDKEALATSLEATSKVQPPELMNAEAIAKNLYMLAQQIREAQSVEAPSRMQ